MSDLKELRDHARQMADSEHAGRCLVVNFRHVPLSAKCLARDDHDPHEWLLRDVFRRTCPGVCSGCMTVRERALWLQIAAEVGEHLARPSDEEQGALPL